MKVCDIVVGGTYTNGKGGSRKVLHIGPDGHGETYIDYELIAGKSNGWPKSEGGKEYFSCYMPAFQRWAKAKVDAA
ncbi:hypothetical protein ACYPKM_00865 [Pseudomonas aeruginosa]